MFHSYGPADHLQQQLQKVNKQSWEAYIQLQQQQLLAQAQADGGEALGPGPVLIFQQHVEDDCRLQNQE